LTQKVTVKVTAESAGCSWTVLDGTKLHNSSHIKSITYALRSRANVTESDSNGLEWTGVGHIMVTLIVSKGSSI